MGLDMYLSVKEYVSRYQYDDKSNPTLRKQFLDIQNCLVHGNLVDINDWTGFDVNIPVGYWRKAHAIHDWIVTNVADGVDDCKKIYFPQEKRNRLLNVCKLVKMTGHQATKAFLPAYEIDDWYWTQLENTIKILESVKDFDDVYYQASW